MGNYNVILEDPDQRCVFLAFSIDLSELSRQSSLNNLVISLSEIKRND